MPRSDKYSGDSGKHSGAASGGSTGIEQGSGGVDSGSQVTVAFDVSADKFYTRVIAEQNLTVFERENIGKVLPAAVDGQGGSYVYKGGCSDESRDRSKSPNETYPGAQNDTRRDFSKGHGAGAPTQLSPERVNS